MRISDWSSDVCSSDLTLSIMRPSVSDEAKPKPAQPAEPLNEQISFAQGGTALDDASRAQLDALAQNPEMIHGRAITVRGHSDSGGSDSDNFRVSEARAKAVADSRVTTGIAAARTPVLGVGEKTGRASCRESGCKYVE